MFIETLVVGPLENNCYIVGQTDKIAVIDPGYEEERIWKHIEEKGYKTEYIILTHGHFDHVGGAGYLQEKTGAKIVLHEQEVAFLTKTDLNLSGWMNNKVNLKADLIVKDGDCFLMDDLVFSVIHTPGHTKGGMCILADDNLFSGDSLFYHDIGRTDLPTGDYQELLDSVRNKLMGLPPRIKVYPGHMKPTTIKEELENNPYVNNL